MLRLFAKGTTAASSSLSVLPEPVPDAIRTIALQRSEPSLVALRSHIASLEQEIRNNDFQLQFIFHQCTSTSALLAAAKKQLDKLLV